MGEQSNAYRILLRYDRKSRHRRIKKRRRYERLAATSQLSLWKMLIQAYSERMRRFTGSARTCGNFSGTSSFKLRRTKGSIGHTFMVCIHTENQNQGDFYPFVLLEISVLHEPPLGHLRYGLTDVPPQPNSPPDNVFNPGRPAKDLKTRSWTKVQPRFTE